MQNASLTFSSYLANDGPVVQWLIVLRLVLSSDAFLSCLASEMEELLPTDLNQPAISQFSCEFFSSRVVVLLIVIFMTINSSNMLTNIIYLFFSLTLSMEN